MVVAPWFTLKSHEGNFSLDSSIQARSSRPICDSVGRIRLHPTNPVVSTPLLAMSFAQPLRRSRVAQRLIRPGQSAAPGSPAVWLALVIRPAGVTNSRLKAALNLSNSVANRRSSSRLPSRCGDLPHQRDRVRACTPCRSAACSVLRADRQPVAVAEVRMQPIRAACGPGSRHSGTSSHSASPGCACRHTPGRSSTGR